MSKRLRGVVSRDLVQRLVSCPLCGARPEQVCTTPSGVAVDHLHSVRWTHYYQSRFYR